MKDFYNVEEYMITSYINNEDTGYVDSVDEEDDVAEKDTWEMSTQQPFPWQHMLLMLFFLFFFNNGIYLKLFWYQVTRKCPITQ